MFKPMAIAIQNSVYRKMSHPEALDKCAAELDAILAKY
jgi:hypothetical protein